MLLYLLQVADHSQIDLPQAVQDKLARNASKYPAKRAIARVSPSGAAVPGTHVLLDYENVQPTEAELRPWCRTRARCGCSMGRTSGRSRQRFASFGTA